MLCWFVYKGDLACCNTSPTSWIKGITKLTFLKAFVGLMLTAPLVGLIPLFGGPHWFCISWSILVLQEHLPLLFRYTTRFSLTAGIAFCPMECSGCVCWYPSLFSMIVYSIFASTAVLGGIVTLHSLIMDSPLLWLVPSTPADIVAGTIWFHCCGCSLNSLRWVMATNWNVYCCSGSASLRELAFLTVPWSFPAKLPG